MILLHYLPCNDRKNYYFKTIRISLLSKLQFLTIFLLPVTYTFQFIVFTK